MPGGRLSVSQVARMPRLTGVGAVPQQAPFSRRLTSPHLDLVILEIFDGGRADNVDLSADAGGLAVGVSIATRFSRCSDASASRRVSLAVCAINAR